MQTSNHRISVALIAYVLSNPLACDSQDGIERWWLAGRVARSRDVQRSLDWMVQEGLLRVKVAADRRRTYRRAASDEALRSALDALLGDI